MPTFNLTAACLAALLTMNSVPINAQDNLLDLVRAEKLAIAHDAILQMKRAESKALREHSVAADTLPDPRVSLGLVNYPTDTFARDQEPMTQTRIAIQQMLPRGNTRALKSRRFLETSEITNAIAMNRERKIRMQVRSVYLELFYWQRAETVVEQNKSLFKQLVRITESQYASGIQRQQDVIRAELELDMLDDRLDMVRTKQEQTRAQLQKLTGVSISNQSLEPDLPVLPTIAWNEDFNLQAKNHPQVKIEDARIARSQYDIELAKQSYKPEWMFEVAYGFRDGTNPDGSERPDFASAMISLDIPLFTKNRQDRQVAASQLNFQAANDARTEVIRQLHSDYQQAKATWRKLKARLERYKNVIVPQSKENARAALSAYQSRRGDFTSLMRARITELETELNYTKLDSDFLKVQARLLYLAGERL